MHLLNKVITGASFNLAIACLLLMSAGNAPVSSAQATAPNKATAEPRPHHPLIDRRFEPFYNLEYDEAIPGFERALGQQPNDPLMVHHLTTGFLMREL